MVSRFFLKLSLLVILPLAVVALLLSLATSPRPSVAGGADVAVSDLERGRQVWSTLGLRNLREGQERQVRLSERDLNLGLNTLAGRLGLEGIAVDISRDRMEVGISRRVPQLPGTRYMNMKMVLAQDGARLTPVELRVGTVPLPAALAGRLLGWGMDLWPAAAQYKAAWDMLRSARLEKDQIALGFVWRGQHLEQAMERGAGLDPGAVDAYRQRLASVRERDFGLLLGQVFSLARERSTKGDAVAENRAALTALAERALGQRLVSVRGLNGLGRRGSVHLRGRQDFAQHFALSAFLAATGGGGLSDAAGLFKELRDASEGSGFSFNDLAADRAGSRLGEMGTRSGRDAARFQERLAGITDAGVFFPRVDDLPEFMHQAEFQSRFGGVGAPAYKAMEEKIERRIAALPLYH